MQVPRLDMLPGHRVRMQIKARDVMMALRQPGDVSALNVIPAVVAEIGPLDGPGVEIKLDCGGEALVARLTRYSVERLSLRAGTPVFAIVKSVSFDRSALGAAWHAIPVADAAAGSKYAYASGRNSLSSKSAAPPFPTRKQRNACSSLA